MARASRIPSSLFALLQGGEGGAVRSLAASLLLCQKKKSLSGAETAAQGWRNFGTRGALGCRLLFSPLLPRGLLPPHPAREWALPCSSHDERGTFAFPYIEARRRDSSRECESRRRWLRRAFTQPAGTWKTLRLWPTDRAARLLCLERGRSPTSPRASFLREPAASLSPPSSCPKEIHPNPS